MRRLTALLLGLLVLLSAACAAGRPDAAVPTTLEQAPSRHARVDGLRVHYKVAGRGGDPDRVRARLDVRFDVLEQAGSGLCEGYRLHPKKTVALIAVDGSLRPYLVDPVAIERFLAPYRGPEFRLAQARFLDAMIPEEEAKLRENVKTIALAVPQHVLVSIHRSHCLAWVAEL